jgi:hypothetical protein
MSLGAIDRLDIVTHAQLVHRLVGRNLVHARPDQAQEPTTPTSQQLRHALLYAGQLLLTVRTFHEVGPHVWIGLIADVAQVSLGVVRQPSLFILSQQRTGKVTIVEAQPTACWAHYQIAARAIEVDWGPEAQGVIQASVAVGTGVF